MVLVALIDRFAKDGAQFIIATHSPFILGYAKATIVNLDDGIRMVKFKETKIYNLYRHFLADPEGYRKLFLLNDQSQSPDKMWGFQTLVAEGFNFRAGVSKIRRGVSEIPLWVSLAHACTSQHGMEKRS